MTAVEELIDQLTSIGALEIPQGSNVVTYIIKQAKEIEKEQNNDKIQNAIELFEQVKIQADTDKDVTYLDNVLAVLYGIKNNL